MKKIFLYMMNEVSKNDFTLIKNYEDYEIERIRGIRTPFSEWIHSFNCELSDDVFVVISRPYILGESLDAFLTNGLKCIEKGLKVVFKCRFNLSFHQMIDYNVYTTKEQQKAAFSSVYSVIMTDVYAHKNGRKRDIKEVKLLRNYWLAYVYKNCRAFKGSLTLRQVFEFLHISSKTMQELKYEVQNMLDNGKQSELEAMVVNELYSKDSCISSEATDERKDNKQLERFKERLAKALSSDSVQMELFTSEEAEDKGAVPWN